MGCGLTVIELNRTYTNNALVASFSQIIHFSAVSSSDPPTTSIMTLPASKRCLLLLIAQALGCFQLCVAFSAEYKGVEMTKSRRSFVTTLSKTVGATATIVTLPSMANAGIDPSQLKNLPVQGDASGTAQRLRQIEAVQRPSSDLQDIPFEQLPSGVSYREYRDGKGEAGSYAHA